MKLSCWSEWSYLFGLCPICILSGKQSYSLDGWLVAHFSVKLVILSQPESSFPTTFNSIFTCRVHLRIIAVPWEWCKTSVLKSWKGTIKSKVTRELSANNDCWQLSVTHSHWHRYGVQCVPRINYLSVTI